LSGYLAGVMEMVDRRIMRARRRDPRRVENVPMLVVNSYSGSADLADEAGGDVTAPGVDVVAGQTPNVDEWVLVLHTGGQPDMVLI